MKIACLILFLILVVPMLFAADVLSAEFAMEIGWLPQGVFCMYTSEDVYDLANTFYTSMEARVFLFDCFFIGGGTDVLVHSNSINSFSSDGINYMFILGLRFGIAEIFYQHNCLHPAPTYTYFDWFAPQWEAWYDRIGIRIEGKIGGK